MRLHERTATGLSVISTQGISPLLSEGIHTESCACRNLGDLRHMNGQSQPPICFLKLYDLGLPELSVLASYLYFNIVVHAFILVKELGGNHRKTTNH
jgi:hypothetical protein